MNPVGIDEAESLHLNTWYQYTSNISFGVEYQRRQGELNDGTDPDIDRIGFHVIYGFLTNRSYALPPLF